MSPPTCSRCENPIPVEPGERYPVVYPCLTASGIEQVCRACVEAIRAENEAEAASWFARTFPKLARMMERQRVADRAAIDEPIKDAGGTP